MGNVSNLAGLPPVFGDIEGVNKSKLYIRYLDSNVIWEKLVVEMFGKVEQTVLQFS